MIETQLGTRSVYILECVKKGNDLVIDSFFSEINGNLPNTFFLASQADEKMCSKIMEIDNPVSFWNGPADIFYKSYDLNLRSTCSSPVDSFVTFLASHNLYLRCFKETNYDYAIESIPNIEYKDDLLIFIE